MRVSLVASDTISSALCGVMEQALIEKGIEPALARALATKACEPAVEAVPNVAKAVAKKAKRASRKARGDLSRALKEANRRLRKKNGQLRKGKTQSDVMSLAQRLRGKV